jgi:uncharacterized protein
MAMAKNILITGASGLIGTKLTELLTKRGDRVIQLGRMRKSSSADCFTWNIDRQEIEEGALEQADTIIHLAGAGVAEKRWTPERKREILESRTKSTALLYKALAGGSHRVQTVVSASGIGYYGYGDSDTVFTEMNSAGSDFLARVTQEWEQAVDRIAELGIRVVKIRIGIVLSRDGGALPELAKPVRLGVGAPLGTGNQMLSWIHIDDLAGIFIEAVDNTSFRGAYNAVAHSPVTNREMTKTIARILGRPLILPAVPAWTLKLMLGEMAEIVLQGSNVSGEKVWRTGYAFRYTRVEDALNDLLK